MDGLLIGVAPIFSPTVTAIRFHPIIVPKPRAMATQIGTQDGAPQKLAGRGVFFIDSRGAAHNDFMTRAWIANPLRDLLARMR